MDQPSVGRRQVHLLGRPRVQFEGDEHVLGPDLRHQLLAYLAYDGGWVERVRLAELFWGDSDEATANQNLRQLLQRSRRLPWTADLEVDRRHLRWRVWTDAAARRHALAAGQLDEAAASDQGPLMDGLEGHAANEFATWLGIERERVWADTREALLRSAELHRRSGDAVGAAAILDRVLHRDPFDEEAMAARLVAASQAGAGGALKAYRGFAERLRSEMGLEPSAGTRNLAAVLERSQAEASAQLLSATTTAAPPLPQRPGTAGPSAAEAGTSFVGRDLELATLAERFSRPDGRLVTVIGPSGMGKTRLARESGRELAERFPDGVVFVPLLDVAEAAALPRAIAGALGLWLQGDAKDLTRLTIHLASRKVLLILDNFEHLMAAAPIVAELLASAPGIGVLATSHQRLGLASEWLVPLEGLSLPPAGTALQDARRFDAVGLFVQRAQQVEPGFELQAGDLPSVLAICRAVDRSPLGIELAAAWVRVLTVQEIAERIEATLGFLESGAPDLPSRHRSLRAAFDYTWAMLPAVERMTLARLAVFRGGFDHAAAASVGGAQLATLAALLDKSLLKAGQGRRFDVHHQLRPFLEDELAALEEEPKRTRDLHLRYWVAVVEDPEAKAGGSAFRRHRARLASEVDNLHAALDWAAAGGRVDLGLRLAGPLLGLWTGLGDLRGSRERLARLLEIASRPAREAPCAPCAAWARTLNAAGSLSMFMAEFDAAEAYLTDGMAMAKTVGSRVDEARLSISFGSVALRRGDRAEARRRYLAGHALLQEHPDQEAMVALLNNLGALAIDDGESGEALRWLDEAMARMDLVPDPALMATVLYNAGWAAWHAGQQQRAFDLLHRSLEASRSVGAVLREAGALNTLALLEATRGDLAAAEAASAEALRLRARMSDRFGLAFSFEARAFLAARQGMAERAARLLGAAQALRQRLDSPLALGWQVPVEQATAQARAALGEAAFDTAYAVGASLPTEAAVELAGRSPGG